MRLLIALMVLSAVIFLHGCKKLDTPMQGYFFVQNTTEDFTLFINDEMVGILAISPTLPLICEDSTWVATTPFEIIAKKNRYRLVDINNTTVAQGTFKLRDNGEGVSSRGMLDFGINYSTSNNEVFIMGFNTDTLDHDHLMRCAGS